MVLTPAIQTYNSLSQSQFVNHLKLSYISSFFFYFRGHEQLRSYWLSCIFYIYIQLQSFYARKIYMVCKKKILCYSKLSLFACPHTSMLSLSGCPHIFICFDTYSLSVYPMFFLYSYQVFISQFTYIFIFCFAYFPTF